MMVRSGPDFFEGLFSVQAIDKIVILFMVQVNFNPDPQP